ncbi:hypothetical protein [Halpernia frigidisoli]|uniref:Uncharacterized protein n=1 Tax=Halpernia frigidisoli TaxID=1125876 RepID=A0A1I3GMY2_9FLAO|nr:hypothetical protein [Halpernia frigidisoli]SFI24773.1 hypothetical protein SAMN05443292_1930 [Halpernia frigidisoli]
MKFWSILTLVIFFNFTALPSIAALAGWKLPSANITVNEEESHSNYSPFSVNEKALPKTLDVFDYLKFFEADQEGVAFFPTDDSLHLAPFLLIFSPPPNA